MRKNIGNAIAQYGIIILLIAIAGVGVLTVLGQNILKGLTSFNDSMIKTNATVNKNQNISTYSPNVSTSSVAAGELGGTSDAPVRSCSGDLCSIDYGDFVLNGIPSDFQEFVKTAGNSGGTDAVLAVFDQMIADIEDTADADEIALLKELSNLGHGMATTEGFMEQSANSLASDTTSVNDLGIQSGVLDGYVSDLKTQDTDFASKLQEIVAKYSGSSDPNDAQVLAVTEALAGQIQSLSSQIKEDTTVLTEFSDSITNGEVGSGEVIGTDASMMAKVEEITNPNSSEITNLDSALICKTGNAEDLGNECN